LNTSKVGQNIIQFTPTTTAAKAKRSIDLDPFDYLPTPTASSSASASSSTSAPSSISGPLAAVGSFFEGIWQNVTAAIDGNTSDGETQLLFQEVLQNITAAIDGDLTDGEAQLVADVVDGLGIQQYYSLHLLDMCSGNLSNSSDADATVSLKECISYSDHSGGKFSNHQRTRALN
jgi:hypothetical protein